MELSGKYLIDVFNWKKAYVLVCYTKGYLFLYLGNSTGNVGSTSTVVM